MVPWIPLPIASVLFRVNKYIWHCWTGPIRDVSDFGEGSPEPTWFENGEGVEVFNWVDLIEMMWRDRVEENAGSGNQNESQDPVERVNDT